MSDDMHTTTLYNPRTTKHPTVLDDHVFNLINDLIYNLIDLIFNLINDLISNLDDLHSYVMPK